MNYTRFISETDAYKQAGWGVFTPLPAGAKFPPAPGMTGNVPYGQRLANVSTAWADADDHNNVGLVLATPDDAKFDVIAIDVDDYGDKKGFTNLVRLMRETHDLEELDLDNIPRSTRRGAESVSAQFFVRVPKGVKWKNSVCEHVDVVQPSHRYSVVWPSVVDGAQYQWFLGDEAIEVPRIEDLPELAPSWVNFLQKGILEPSVTCSTFTSAREALEWLRTRVIGGRAEELDLSWENGSRHDLMHFTVSRLVKAALFRAATGVVASLKALKEEFLSATEGENRGAEFNNSIVSVVNHCKALLDSGEEEDINWLIREREIAEMEIDTTALVESFKKLFAAQGKLGKEHTYGKLTFTSLENAVTRSAQWVWGNERTGGIPVGGLTIITGKPGDGKSTMCRWLASEITNGTLNGSWSGTPYSVLYLSAEESLEHMVNPSLEANGANKARVKTLMTPIDPRADMDAVIGYCKDQNVKAVFVDPLSSYMGNTDTHRNSDVREALKPWTRLAEEIDGTVVAIVHQTKSAGSDFVSGINGSSAYGEVARAVFATAVDAETGKRVVSQGKNSIGTLMPSYEYELEIVDLKAEDGSAKPSPRFKLGSETTISAGEIFNRNKRVSNGETQTAKEWLREYLQSRDGALRAEVLQDGKGAFSQSAIDKAAKDLKVRKETRQRQVFWSLE